MKFKVGDRVFCNLEKLEGDVVCVENYSHGPRNNLEEGIIYGIDFGKQETWYHNLNGRLKTNTGWFCSDSSLRLVKRRMMIYRRENG